MTNYINFRSQDNPILKPNTPPLEEWQKYDTLVILHWSTTRGKLLTINVGAALLGRFAHMDLLDFRRGYRLLPKTPLSTYEDALEYAEIGIECPYVFSYQGMKRYESTGSIARAFSIARSGQQVLRESICEQWLEQAYDNAVSEYIEDFTSELLKHNILKQDNIAAATHALDIPCVFADTPVPIGMDKG